MEIKEIILIIVKMEEIKTLIIDLKIDLKRKENKIRMYNNNNNSNNNYKNYRRQNFQY